MVMRVLYLSNLGPCYCSLDTMTLHAMRVDTVKLAKNATLQARRQAGPNYRHKHIKGGTVVAADPQNTASFAIRLQKT